MCIFVSLFSHYMAKKGQKMHTSPIVYIFNIQSDKHFIFNERAVSCHSKKSPQQRFVILYSEVFFVSDAKSSFKILKFACSYCWKHVRR